MFKKIKNKSVVQTVVDSITKAIIAGELKPGDKIPTELELAESWSRKKLDQRGHKDSCILRHP